MKFAAMFVEIKSIPPTIFVLFSFQQMYFQENSFRIICKIYILKLYFLLKFCVVKGGQVDSNKIIFFSSIALFISFIAFST